MALPVFFRCFVLLVLPQRSGFLFLFFVSFLKAATDVVMVKLYCKKGLVVAAALGEIEGAKNEVGRERERFMRETDKERREMRAKKWTPRLHSARRPSFGGSTAAPSVYNDF